MVFVEVLRHSKQRMLLMETQSSGTYQTHILNGRQCLVDGRAFPQNEAKMMMRRPEKNATPF